MKRQPNCCTICAYCGKPVLKWAYTIRQHPRHFCGNVCKGKWMSLHIFAEKASNWKGGNYSTIANTLCNSRYRRIRQMAIVLDNKKCVLCDSIEKLQIHHIIEKGKNPELIFDITNMITLCRKCHFSIRGKEEDFIGVFDGIIAKRVNCGKPRTGNPQPSLEIANRLKEGSETKAEETITPTSALPERDEIVQFS